MKFFNWLFGKKQSQEAPVAETSTPVVEEVKEKKTVKTKTEKKPKTSKTKKTK